MRMHPSFVDALGKTIAASDRRQTSPAVAADLVTIRAAHERIARRHCEERSDEAIQGRLA
jgi:hypothetical protein